MQKRRIRMLVLTAALATTAVAVAKLQQTNFSDVPAGHWAQTAVQAIAQEGLITGYPDGTYQGNRTLTRYEAATIFYRLLQSGKLQQATPATQTAVQQGLADVNAELAKLTTQANGTNDRLAALETKVEGLSSAPAATPAATTPPAPATNPDYEARIKALEDELAALKAATPAAPAVSPELEARIKTIEDELAALKAAPPPAPAATTPPAPATNADYEARIKALEDKVASLASAPAATPAATTPPAPATNADYEARIKALEDKVAAAPDTAALQNTVSKQDARITSLEASVAALQSAVNDLKTAAATTPPPPATPAVVTPPPTPTPPAPITTGSSDTGTSSGPGTSIALGLGGAANITGPVGAGASPFGLYAQLAVVRLAGPIGIRAFADLSSVPAVGGQLMLNLGDNSFDPYIGVGGGVIFNTPSAFFVGGSLGANLGFGGGFGVFAEINPRYILSTNQFSVKAAFGVRLAF